MRESLPFVGVAVVWLVLGCIGLSITQQSAALGVAILWFIGLWLLVLVDLIAMERAIASVMGWVTEEEPANKPVHIVRTMVWGGLKLACLVIFGVVLFMAKAAPSGALLAGLSTLVIVPLVGGACWSLSDKRLTA